MSEDEFVEAIFQRDLRIKKLNKKIKELEKELEEYKKRLTPTPDNCVPIEYQMIGYVDKRGYISKDKIKDKIKKYRNLQDNEKDFMYKVDLGTRIDELQELLKGE